jgi:hypothetical protein
MSYKISAKNRRLKRILLNIISILKFESLNIETPRKLVFFWVMLWFASLFLNWTESVTSNHVWNAFKSILWITWYLLFAIDVKLLFIIFETKIKERIKFLFNFYAKDWVIVVFLWAFWLFLTINSIFIIENFSYFTAWIIIWRWVILSVVSYIFVLMWWMLMLKTKTNTSIYIDWQENNEDTREVNEFNESNKNNMKLPF